jgi:hypothetical protein
MTNPFKLSQILFRVQTARLVRVVRFGEFLETLNEPHLLQESNSVARKCVCFVCPALSFQVEFATLDCLRVLAIRCSNTD